MIDRDNEDSFVSNHEERKQKGLNKRRTAKSHREADSRVHKVGSDNKWKFDRSKLHQEEDYEDYEDFEER